MSQLNESYSVFIKCVIKGEDEIVPSSLKPYRKEDTWILGRKTKTEADGGDGKGDMEVKRRNC